MLTPVIFLAFAVLSSLDAQEGKPKADLPASAGKQILMKRCDSCHELESVTSLRLTEEGWKKKIDAMIDRGAELSDDEYLPLLNYLVANFGKK